MDLQLAVDPYKRLVLFESMDWLPKTHKVSWHISANQISTKYSPTRGRVLARLRVWDAMLCNVDAQTSKFSFSKGSRFFSLDPMKLTAKRKPIYCFFHAMNCIPFFFLMIFLWHDLKMWKSSLNHLRKKPKRSLYFPTCKCQIRQSSHPQWPCR